MEEVASSNFFIKVGLPGNQPSSPQWLSESYLSTMNSSVVERGLLSIITHSFHLYGSGAISRNKDKSLKQKMLPLFLLLRKSQEICKPKRGGKTKCYISFYASQHHRSFSSFPHAVSGSLLCLLELEVSTSPAALFMGCWTCFLTLQT